MQVISGVQVRHTSSGQRGMNKRLDDSTVSPSFTSGVTSEGVAGTVISVEQVRHEYAVNINIEYGLLVESGGKGGCVSSYSFTLLPNKCEYLKDGYCSSVAVCETTQRPSDLADLLPHST